jgi:hypothetical protein
MNKRAGLSRAQGLRCSGSQFDTRVQVAGQGSLTLRQVEGERLAGPLTQNRNPVMEGSRRRHSRLGGLIIDVLQASPASKNTKRR